MKLNHGTPTNYIDAIALVTSCEYTRNTMGNVFLAHTMLITWDINGILWDIHLIHKYRWIDKYR